MTSKPNPRRANGNRRNAVRKRVMACDDICGLCGKSVDKSLPPGDPMCGAIDEIVPVSRGSSPYDINNLQLVHRICNQCKEDKHGQSD